jgi:ribosome-associated protein
MAPKKLRDHVVRALEDLKGKEIVALDVSRATSVTDYMVIASGTSNRHVKALVDNVLESSKASGVPSIGVEGLEAAEWVLLDLGDVVVHVMQKEARDFYDLERLWSEVPKGVSKEVAESTA